MNRLFWAGIMGAAAVLAGCAAPSSGHHAPIVDRSVPAGGSGAAEHGASRKETPEQEHESAGDSARQEPGAQQEAAVPPEAAVPQEQAAQTEKDWRPEVYRVQPGDTLYSIAFNFGFDYHELAELNNIPNPAVIHPGQEIRLFPAAGSRTAESKPVAPEIKSQPVVVKLPYSEQAAGQIEKLQTVPARVETQAGAGTKPGTEVKAPKPQVSVRAGVAPGDVPVQWEMPASGKVVAGFAEGENRKGVDIAGKLGQPIYASGAGKVVYSGNGLRGYGKLVIIKHNSTYLSAYAHNDKLLVKEGQMVAKGQMIAQMGSTDANRVALHFEIRKLGQPVDPAKYLVFPKS